MDKGGHPADKYDANSVQQMIRISSVLILANLIRIQKPHQDLATCKMQALEQLENAVEKDWIL